MSFVIKEVAIKNFRSHADSRVVFDEGINLISGRNGSGKTSILEAILVALYGSRPTGMRKEDLIRSGASSYSITLKFLLDGKEYTIVRTSDGSSRLIGDIQLEGESQINSWVERHIAPSHVFTNAIYVRQGEIDAIVRDDESRERVIRKVTRIEDYETAWKNLGVIIRMFESEAKSYRQFASQEEELKKQKSAKEEELKKKQEELESCYVSIKELEVEVAELERRKKKLDELASTLSKLRIEAEKVAGEIRAVKSKLASLEEQKRAAEDRIDKLRQDVARCKELESLARRYEELERLYKDASEKLHVLDRTLVELKARRQKLNEELKRIEGEKAKVEELTAEMEGIRERLEELSNIAEKWERVRPKIDRLRQIESQLGDYTPEKIESMYATVLRAREEEKKIQDAFAKLAAKKSALITRGKQYKKALEELKGAKGVCPVCGRELDDDLRAKLVKSYTSELKRIKDELAELDEMSRKLEDRRAKIEAAVKKQEIVLKLKQLADEMVRLQSEINGIDVSALKEGSEEYAKLRDRYERLKGEVEAVKGSISKEGEVKQLISEVEREIEEVEEERGKTLDLINKAGFESLDAVKDEAAKLKDAYTKWLELRNSAEKLREEEEKLRSIKEEIEIAQKEVAAKGEELAEIRRKLSEIDRAYDEEKHREVERKYVEKSNALQGLKSRAEVLKESVENLKKDIENLAKQIENVKEYRRKAEIIEKEVLPELNRVREKFRKYKNAVAEAALKEVEYYASEIFEEFTEGKYAGIRLKQVVEKKEKLKVFVLYQGEEKDISFLSGGELIALGLAFRLALTMFMVKGNIPLLILDEPTPFLDEERRRKLVDITTSYLRRIPQVIVVSHDDELKDAADRVISVEYTAGASRVSYVEA